VFLFNCCVSKGTAAVTQGMGCGHVRQRGKWGCWTYSTHHELGWNLQNPWSPLKFSHRILDTMHSVIVPYKLEPEWCRCSSQGHAAAFEETLSAIWLEGQRNAMNAWSVKGSMCIWWKARTDFEGPQGGVSRLCCHICLIRTTKLFNISRRTEVSACRSSCCDLTASVHPSGRTGRFGLLDQACSSVGHFKREIGVHLLNNKGYNKSSCPLVPLLSPVTTSMAVFLPIAMRVYLWTIEDEPLGKAWSSWWACNMHA